MSRLLSFFTVVASLFLLGKEALGQVTINSLTTTYTAPGYVIESDTGSSPTTGRHRIRATSQITVNTNGSYRLRWTLINAAGTTMVTRTEAAENYAIGVIPRDGYVAPLVAAPLQPGALYRMKMEVLNSAGTTVIAERTDTARTYIHFTSSNASDTAKNVIAIIDSVAVNRRWLLESNTARRKIPTTINYTLHRYDAWDVVPNSTTVNVQGSATLRRTSDGAAQTVTVTTGTTNTLGVDSHLNAPPTRADPSTVSGSVTVDLDPTAIIAPDDYTIALTIKHQDEGTTYKTGMTKDSASVGIAHFSGQLNGGSITSHFTDFASAPGDVTVPAPVPSVSIHKDIKPTGGSIDGISGYSFDASATALRVSLDASGVATIISPATAYLNAADEEAKIGEINGIRFKRNDAIFSYLGVTADISMQFPAGSGWSSSKEANQLQGWLDLGSSTFNQALQPIPTTFSDTFSPGTRWIFEETKPVMVEVTTFTWNVATGQISTQALAQAHPVRRESYDFLKVPALVAAYPSATMSEKKSNDHLYDKCLTATNFRLVKGASGGAEASGSFQTPPHQFTTHFPYGAGIQWSGLISNLAFVNDVLDPANSALFNASNVTQTHWRHCESAGCGTTSTETLALTPDLVFASPNPGLLLTADGGIHAQGSFGTPATLEWGYISANTGGSPLDDYAQSVASSFARGNFLMAGTFLRGDLLTAADENGPAVLLLSGFTAGALSTGERPNASGGFPLPSDPYVIGAADYPGLNFRTDGTYDGQSTLQGAPFGPYDLTNRSKYYARLSGVTGIHEATSAGFPLTTVIGGYDFTLTSFGLSFLSNELLDSRTAGNLDLDAPTDATFGFSELIIDCLGNLTSLKLNNSETGVDSKTWAHWDADFTPLGAEFVACNTCDPGDGTTFVASFTAHAAFIEEDITGSLGINPDGNFVTLGDLAGMASCSRQGAIPARIVLPANMSFAESSTGAYTFNPTQGAYFNKPLAGDVTGSGYWSLFGTLDVPFFNDLQIHLHTTAEADDASAILRPYLMGGWPDHGWEISGTDPFNSITFDSTHRARPTGVTLANYHPAPTGTSEDYRPRAQQMWLGVINFDYPLQWEGSTFDFKGSAPKENNFLVLQTQHQLNHLSNDLADISFGLSYDFTGQVNITSLLLNAVDDGIGMADAFIDSVSQEVYDELTQGIDEFADLLNDKSEELLGPPIDIAFEAGWDALEVQLQGITFDPNDIATWRAQVTAAINVAFSPDKTQAGALLIKELEKLKTQTGVAADFLNDLDGRLTNCIQAIYALTKSGRDVDVDNALPAAVDGLLWVADHTNHDVPPEMAALTKALAEVFENVVDTALNDLIDNALAKYDPLIDEAVERLNAVADLLKQVRTEIRSAASAAQGLGREIKDILDEAIDTISGDIAVSISETRTFFLALVASAPEIDIRDHRLQLIDEWHTNVKFAFDGYLYAKQFVQKIQDAIKAEIYELKLAFDEAVDSALAQIEAALKEALTEIGHEIDDAINDMIPDWVNKLGAGEISGFAHITGDSLDLLRIDGKFQFNAPDPMNLRAYLEIRELDSDGPGGCLLGSDTAISSESAVETKIGAMGIPIEFPGATDVKFDIEVKFAFDSSGDPVGLGGSFEMKDGEISVPATGVSGGGVTIDTLGAAVMFGREENYFASEVGMKFNGYSMAGSCFFGRTCTLDPLLMVDEDLSEALAAFGVEESMPLTGVYCYGEVGNIPIFGTGTCLFNISAKVGGGPFFFYTDEDTIFGGRVTLGVKGEALCAVDVGGEVSLLGALDADSGDFAFFGEGRIFGGVGKKPFRIEFDKTVEFDYLPDPETDKYKFKVTGF